MPRQERRVPFGMNRFNYWNWSITHPQWEQIPGEVSTDDEMHRYCATEFRSTLKGQSQESAQFVTNRRVKLRLIFGSLVDAPETFALCWYIFSDKLWQQDQEAWDLLKRQPKRTREMFLSFDRKKWRYKSPWSWGTLLRQIARDQEIFRETVNIGPTASGLVESRREQAWEPERMKWRQWRYRPGMAKKVYSEYTKQFSGLLGKGFVPPNGWREDLQSAGLLDEKGRIPSKPFMDWLEGKPYRVRLKFTDSVLHWFAHALINLRNYRDGRLKLPPPEDHCSAKCRKVQQNLCLFR